MRHLGDICKINGAEVEPCWLVVGGSPCQDLSIAGKRAGLAGERSGLYMEQIRIVKEMRAKDETIGRRDEHIRPRFLLWENVPGALSSGEPKGEDFRIVLEECARVKDPNAVIPRPPKGKWQNCGCIVGDGWSIAWTIRNAQFYGIPQRRRRIALVADFGGETAPEILFERKGLSGDTTEGGKEKQGAAGDSTDCVGETGKCLNPWDVQSKHVQSQNGVPEALYSGECRGGGGESYVMQETYGISPYGSNAMLSDNPHSGIYKAETSRTLDLNGGSPACNQGGMAVVMPKTYAMQAIGEYKQGGVASSLKQRDYKDATDLVCSFYPQMKAESQCWREDDKSNTLVNGTNPGYQNGVVYKQMSGDKNDMSDNRNDTKD